MPDLRFSLVSLFRLVTLKFQDWNGLLRLKLLRLVITILTFHGRSRVWFICNCLAVNAYNVVVRGFMCTFALFKHADITQKSSLIYGKMSMLGLSWLRGVWSDRTLVSSPLWFIIVCSSNGAMHVVAFRTLNILTHSKKLEELFWNY